jgi:uncharacterized protein YoxC
MPNDVTRDEFQQLATRTDILEREVEGEKMVTRHILEQTRRNGDDIASLTGKVDGLEVRLDRVEDKVDGLDRKVDGLDRKIDGLSRSIPAIVGEAMREAFREERERKR